MEIEVRVLMVDPSTNNRKIFGGRVKVSECDIMDFPGSPEDLFRQNMFLLTEKIISEIHKEEENHHE